MADVILSFADSSLTLHCRAIEGHERLGEAAELRVEAFSPEPVERGAVVGKSCNLGISNAFGERAIPGVVTSFTARATSTASKSRRYELVLRSGLAMLELTQRSRIFQDKSVPDIVKEVLQGSGWPAANITISASEDHAPRQYVAQYAESDAIFIRRLCEEEGLYFRFESKDGAEVFVLEDTSSSAPDALGGPLPLADAHDLGAPGASAFRPRLKLRRRPGKVTLRDYNQEKPAVDLESSKSAGTAIEKEIEVYEAPGRFADPDLGEVRARRRLEGLRADGEVVRFETTALAIAPGTLVDLDPTADIRSAARPAGKHFVVGLHHRWSAGEYVLDVESIPVSVPYRLPRRTPRPRIAGVQQVFVTGAPGEEIHVDNQGRARVRFLWDRATSGDDKASLPIRVMQPNTPGSMLLPRVGWEVMAAFEDGDPDRPYILGRVYNAKSPPPFGLPANKTVTALGTMSSPGGAKLNQIRFDDAAGRQNVAVTAAFGKSTTVANDMMTQTVKNEAITVKASQSLTVSANEDVSVTEAYRSSLGSQSATVGGSQKIFVKGDMNIGTGSETVLVGGAVLEKVGNPVAGAKNLAKAAALTGAGALGAAGSVITKAYALGEAGYAGYQRGGLSGMASGMAGAGANMIVQQGLSGVPGASDLLGKIQEASPPPWAEKPASGADAAGGGASGGSDTAGPAGPGPGHRNTSITGPITELVGGAVGAITPGSLSWSTIGASTLLVGGSHAIKAGQAGSRTLGVASDTVGSFKITVAGAITRNVKGPINTTIAGSLKSKAGGKHSIKAGGSLSFKVGGGLKLTASKVSFVVGGATLTVSPDGLLLDAGDVTITGFTTQKKPSDHS
ncbi:MAG: type VI secretion system tip protein TssI/VgrG [Byssovorax sp.]